MKWAYIKNGDVVAQLKRIRTEPESIHEAGPDAFITEFLYGVSGQPVLIMSWCNQSAELNDGMVLAKSYLVSGSKAGRLGNILLRLMAAISGARQLLIFKPDLIVCGRFGPMLWVTAIISRYRRIPFIHSRHNSIYESHAKWYQKLLAQVDTAAIRHAKAVICHGPYLAQQMLDIGISADKVIEFDVGFESFQENLSKSTESCFQELPRVILFIGRMERRKGIFDLFEAALPLLEKYPMLAMQYIGDGSDLESLRRNVERKGLTARIECLGRVIHSDLPKYISRAFVVVAPTRREFPEGRCMAVMEALACSVPVIAPENGPFPYLIKSGINGLLYAPDSVVALRAAAEQLLCQHDLYEKLKHGAHESAIVLRKPSRSFFQAIKLAFNI